MHCNAILCLFSHFHHLGVYLPLLQPVAVIEVDGLQIGELIYGCGPGLSCPVSAGFGPAKRQVDLRTNGRSIDIGDACIYPFYRPKSIFYMNQNGP